MGEIVFFETDGNYARAYFGANRPLIRTSLNALEARVDPALFFRASRQHLINLRFVERIEAAADDGYMVSCVEDIRCPCRGGSRDSCATVWASSRPPKNGA
jgi:DNA-binding LytR/AlgR family response regulator